jgi:anti-sigma B factor antagonist
VKRFPPEPFYVRDVVQDGHHRLRLSGELDILAAPRLETVIRRVCAGGPTGLTLDLSRATFIDSSGLRAILLAKELTDEHGYGFALVPGPPNVQRLFELTALLDVLPFEAESAIHSVGVAPPTAETGLLRGERGDSNPRPPGPQPLGRYRTG